MSFKISGNLKVFGVLEIFSTVCGLSTYVLMHRCRYRSVWLTCVIQVESAVHLLRGHIYEAMDNRSQAVHCYRAALLLDVKCFEAFDCLVQHHMMSAAEGRPTSLSAQK